MTSHQHRARDLLVACGKEFPGIWAAYEEVRAEIPQPECAYISEADGAEAYVRALHAAKGKDYLETLRQMSPLDMARHVSPINTLACWRMTQGIYRFDPALYESLIDTPLTGDLPADVLTRLPEWCLYLETPGLHVLKRDGGKADLAGAWVRNDLENGTPALLITLDIPEAPRPESATVILRGTLDESVTETLKAWNSGLEGVAGKVADYLRPIINLILYLVGSDDIAGPHGTPENPKPKRTRRGGVKLFAADGPRSWEVGVRMGDALRRAYHAAEVSGGGTHSGPRPHVRRAHWHSYWTGKIGSDDRKIKPKWLPPIPVNLEEIDALPAVIRKAK